MSTQSKKPVLGFAACSGTGKTTLLVRLIPLLKEKGLRVALIKHAHHDFDIDKPGKDSYELRRAGAGQVLVASSFRRALMTETPGGEEPELGDLIGSLNLDAIDLVLVEGFRHLPFPKIELHRPSTGNDLIYLTDNNIVAVASDEAIAINNLPLLNINNPQQIADFIQGWICSVAMNC
ncbi:MAG: molybdopterin-guanine dinucleotide biosynthesis protein MobB [Gammaproteobacteria bacterium]|nr:molybdopterin-guanine dinucleotide biosynthesis protein MobB [Gammaproteobacteria bacterium]MCW8924338.1 molybdopterin-guanine dinucleotide biosynthesis protein MobB [Gammaproteobacteria bacterium]